ncbi:GNAT family N-acetyltransferase [Kineothrix alysoides]|uniref:GNAT family N-acetyltransferase n=1 Tax=Kineothrix alysoides TaxID=1469948 RepID=UPI002FE5918A
MEGCNINTPVLESERLILRKFNENDMQALLDIYKDKEVNIYLPWFPLKSPEEAKVFFEEKYEKAYQQPRGCRYVQSSHRTSKKRWGSIYYSHSRY